ncbi:MAG: hypothetical protein RL641_702 [Candidatus Parcubacteria bacterium]|jgi:hypothetical protein
MKNLADQMNKIINVLPSAFGSIVKMSVFGDYLIILTLVSDGNEWEYGNNIFILNQTFVLVSEKYISTIDGESINDVVEFSEQEHSFIVGIIIDGNKVEHTFKKSS